MNSQRILYIQYTNPAGYPPLEHSSRLLAERGWDVWFLGTGGQGSSKLTFPHHARIRVSKMPFQHPGWRQKVHYLRYCAWVIRATLSWRPQWLYASDLWSCLPALILRSVPGLRILYHEHDSPDERSRSGLMRMVLAARRQLAQRADLCVLPGQARAQRFRTATGAKPHQIQVVWNCPRLDEVTFVRQPLEQKRIIVLYHGSVVPARLPLSVLEALAQLSRSLHLRIIGYETIGSQGYLTRIQQRAYELAVHERIEIMPPMPRWQLIQRCREADLGLALLAGANQDWNEQTVFSGPSNKVFDYLACGLPLIIADQPDTQQLYVAPGYARACNPDDPTSIAAAIDWYAAHPEAIRAMGERGRQRIVRDWNYEQQFAPVLAQLEAPV